tara:strand:+ start:357 stop:524 length:168 start_codon:yes stop_codon:yes gene_type:complete
MELDTTIMQTKTVKNICEVLIDVQNELVIPENKKRIDEILTRWDVAVSLGSAYKE